MLLLLIPYLLNGRIATKRAHELGPRCEVHAQRTDRLVRLPPSVRGGCDEEEVWWWWEEEVVVLLLACHVLGGALEIECRSDGISLWNNAALPSYGSFELAAFVSREASACA